MQGCIDLRENGLGAEDLRQIDTNSLYLLYRFLFILYAESRITLAPGTAPNGKATIDISRPAPEAPPPPPMAEEEDDRPGPNGHAQPLPVLDDFEELQPAHRPLVSEDELDDLLDDINDDLFG